LRTEGRKKNSDGKAARERMHLKEEVLPEGEEKQKRRLNICPVIGLMKKRPSSGENKGSS